MSEARLKWSEVPLRDLFSKLLNGGTPSTTNPAYWNGTTPWVTGADFTDRGIGDIRRHVSELGIRSSSTSVVEPGNLLVVTRTGVGKLAISREAIAISQDITGVYADPAKADTGFLYFMLQQELNSLKKLNQGTSINGIIRSDLERHRAFVPNDIYEQKKIARILRTIDQTIEKTEALIEKYQQIKAGLMHDLFTRGIGADGKLRPPREQAPELYQETPIGWIPKEWSPKKLNAVLLTTGGYLQTGPFGSQLHAHEYTQEGIPVVMPQNINEGSIEEEQIARITESRAQTLLKHRLRKGDIIIARRGELGRAAAIDEEQTGWVCGTGCFLLRLGGTRLDSRFIAMAYRHPMVQRQVEGLAVGTTMPSLNNEIMGKLVFPDMNPVEQNAIAERVDASQKKIFAMRGELVKLRKENAGLMHDLLTGKVPVKVEPPEAAHV